ncbi:MAG: DUF4129 domain-containing protein [Anaerolineaceae bacterium]
MNRFHPTTKSLNRVLLKLACLAVAAILFLLFHWNGTAAGGSAMPWEEYWRLVDETDRKVTLAEKSPDQTKVLLEDLVDQWENVKVVSLPGGGSLVIDPGVLVTELERVRPKWKALHDLLAKMDASQERESLTIFTPEDARAIQAILAQPEYDWDADQWANPFQRFFRDLLQKFLDFLEELFPDGDVAGPSLNLRSPITIGVLLVLLVVLYFGFRGIFKELIQEASYDEAGQDEVGLSAARAMRLAQGSAGEGDHRQAVRYLYLSALLLLEERGLLRYDRSRTNREYLNSIHEHTRLVPLLRNVIDVFDRVWYGYRPIDANGYEEYVEQVERLKEEK